MKMHLFFALCLVQLIFFDWLPCAADGADSSTKVDYKVVPILQPMKEVAPTPEINLTTPDGKKISLRDFRGKIVMLNFWA
ncbi:MAG TPA: hypothetical protein VE170_14175, partial [Candidatus Limnocylindria bacterium]|nr:hypothetical protein [Candidatus Limnocylindria bacterium]